MASVLPICPGCSSSLEHFIPSLPTSISGSLLSPSYHPLTVAEGTNLREAFDLATRNKQSLETIVGQLETLLDRCKESLGTHKSFIDEHRPVLRSVRRLPAETWAEIFDWANVLSSSEPTEWDAMFTQGHESVSPFNVSHVCRDWRKIAIRRSSLWKKIDIFVEEELPASKINLLVLWLSRSGSIPLNIKIEQQDVASPPEWTIPALKSIFDILKDQSYRWSNVVLDLNFDFLRSVLDGPIGPCPCLRELQINSNQPLDDENWTPRIVGTTRNLYQLHVRNLKLGRGRILQMIPTEFLTHVDLDTSSDAGSDSRLRMSFDSVVEVLTNSPKLLSLRARCGSRNHVTNSMVVHDSLTELYLDCLSPSILDHLAFPSLHTLTLDTYTSPPIHIASFISRSPVLTKIDVDSHGVGVDFIRLLDKSNKVRELDMGIYVDVDPTDALNDIEILQDLASFLPELCNLRIRYVFADGSNAVRPSLAMKDAVVSLAQSSLKSFKVDFGLLNDPCTVVLEPLYYLKELHLEGVEIAFVE